MAGEFTRDLAAQEVVWNENDDASGVADILGFDFGTAETVDRSGLRALVDSALVSHRRLPMLDVIFDRAARLMTTSLRQLADENVEVALDDVASTRFADFQQSLSAPSVIGVARAPALDGHALVAADGAFLLAVVDGLLGGRRASDGLDAGERGFTAIELSIAQRVFEALVENLGDAFRPVMEGGFELQRIETTPRFAAIAQGASVCALAKFRVRFDGRAARAAALIPHATLEPIRKSLAQAFVSEAKSAEKAWRDQLSREISAATVEIDVVIAEEMMPLRALGALGVGETLVFARPTRGVAELRAGGAPIGRGRIGKSGDAAAVEIMSLAGPAKDAPQ
jgi:flagellar motor switch protein FliM